MEDTDVETQTKTEAKKKFGLFKFFHKNGDKNKTKPEESDLHEVSSQGQASFLEDLATSEEGSTIRTEEDTIIRPTTSRKQSFLENVMDEGGKFSIVSEVDGGTKKSTLESRRFCSHPNTVGTPIANRAQTGRKPSDDP